MSFGIWQIALIVLVVVLVFGAGKIPRVMGDFAKGIKSFKSGMKDGEMGEPTPASPTDKPAESGEEEAKAINGETTAADAGRVKDAGGIKKDEAAKG
jgi:sec-independent protein translocase protein TatA